METSVSRYDWQHFEVEYHSVKTASTVFCLSPLLCPLCTTHTHVSTYTHTHTNTHTDIRQTGRDRQRQENRQIEMCVCVSGVCVLWERVWNRKRARNDMHCDSDSVFKTNYIYTHLPFPPSIIVLSSLITVNVNPSGRFRLETLIFFFFFKVKALAIPLAINSCPLNSTSESELYGF